MADIGTLTITLGVDDSGLLTAKTRVNDFVKDIQNKVPKITPALTQPFEVFSKQAIGHIALVSQRIRTFGYLASATITAPMTLAGKAVMSMAKDYEFAIQKIVGLTGTAQSVVNGWSKDIQNMAKEFGRNPKELAEGLYFIVSSGIQGAQALDVLNKSAKAAAAGLGTTQEVANYLTSVLNAYRGTGLTAAYATDVLVAAVREGKAEASGFAAAMGSLTPIASNLGVSIDQVAGAMAGITLTGSTAAQAATYLRGVFNVLMKETKQGSVAMDEASAALGQMKTSYGDLRKILREQGIMALMQKLNELSAAYGETLVSKVFPNIRAMLGVLSLSGKNMKYNSEIMKEITNSSGALGKAFAAVSDTIKIRYDKAIAGMQVSMISLGKQIATALIPMLEWLGKKLEKLAQWFDSLTEEQRKHKVMWGLIIAAAGPALLLFSTLGYTITIVMNTVNGLTKALSALNGVLALTGIVSGKAGAKFEILRKLVTAKNLLGNVEKFIKNPYVLLAAGAVTATVAVGKYAKKIRQIAEDNDVFNKTMLQVNDTMKKFKDLTGTDYEEMSIDQLVAGREKARQVWEQAYKNYQQFQANKDLPFQSDKLNEREAQKQLEHLKFAKQAYDDFGTAIEQAQGKFSSERIAEQQAAIDKVTEATKEQNQALKDTWKTMLDTIRGLEEQSKIYEAIGKPFDLAEEKANVYLDTIKTLTGEKFKLNADSSQVQTLIKWLKDLGINFSDTREKIKKFTDDLNSDLAAIHLRKFIDPSFDDASATFEAYKKNYESLIELVTKSAGKTSLFGIAAGADIAAQVAIIRKAYRDLQLWNEQKEKAEDNKMLNILQSEADAFGGLAGKIEVVSYALQAAQRDLRDMFTKKEEKGVVLDEKAVQETVDRIKQLKSELVDLQNAQELRWLTDMNNALDSASTNTNLLSGHISALEKKLQLMSENGQGSTEMFKSMAKQLQTLTNAQTATDLLADAFTDMFQSIMEGGKDMQQVLSGILKSIINELMAALARLLAMKIIMAIIAPATVGGFMKSISPSSFLSMQTGRFAKGGVVPRGYPNDSYPALLSSGEVVLPKNVADSLSSRNDSSEGGEVVFRIEQDALVGILKKATKKNSLY